MITVAFTPSRKNSKDFVELKNFLAKNTKDSEEIVTLPNGVLEVNCLSDEKSKGVTRIFKEISYEPKRAIVLDARNPNLISKTLKELKDAIGLSEFNAPNLRERFYIITQSPNSNILNQLVTGNNTHLTTLLEKPFFDQVMGF